MTSGKWPRIPLQTQTPGDARTPAQRIAVVNSRASNRSGTVLGIGVNANHKTSPLRLCEYSLDGGFWQPIEAVDCVTDSPRERFHLHLDKLRPGEHLLVFRVYDSANNAGLARVILR